MSRSGQVIHGQVSQLGSPSAVARNSLLPHGDYLDFPVQRLDVSPKTLKKLAKAGKIFTVRQLLSAALMDLRHMGCTKEEAELVFSAAVALRFSLTNIQSHSALDVLHTGMPHSRLSLGCPVVDEQFGGGLLPGSLTEITGAAGVGKTQFCLQLALSAQLPKELGGLDGEVLYLCTEHLPSKRLKQFADRFSSCATTAAANMDRIYIEILSSYDEVFEFLTTRIERLLALKKLKLLIVDSITSIFRYVDRLENTVSYEHTKKIQLLATCLQSLILRHSLTIVCTNQVTSDFSEVANNADQKEPLPSLGLTWANFVNTRIVLSKSYKRKDLNSSPEMSRCIRIDFSPCLAPQRSHFEVVQDAVRGIR